MCQHLGQLKEIFTHWTYCFPMTVSCSVEDVCCPVIKDVVTFLHSNPKICWVSSLVFSRKPFHVLVVTNSMKRNEDRDQIWEASIIVVQLLQWYFKGNCRIPCFGFRRSLWHHYILVIYQRLSSCAQDYDGIRTYIKIVLDTIDPSSL